MAQGNVIVIRDKDEKKKYIKEYKKFAEDESDSDDPDYEQLMAQGTVVIIRDNEDTKKIIKKLK